MFPIKTLKVFSEIIHELYKIVDIYLIILTFQV